MVSVMKWLRDCFFTKAWLAKKKKKKPPDFRSLSKPRVLAFKIKHPLCCEEKIPVSASTANAICAQARDHIMYAAFQCGHGPGSGI